MCLRRLHQDRALRQKAIVHIQRHGEKKMEHKSDISEVIIGGMASVPPFLMSNNQVFYGNRQVKEVTI